MPLPKPRAGEEQSEFVSRCIEAETNASPGRDKDQIAAMCYQAWRDRGKEEAPPPSANLAEGVREEVCQLREEITLDGAEFVEQDGKRTIKNMAILGLKSKHGYEYTEAAVRAAVHAGKYERVRMFVDHSPKDHTRSIMDLAGVFNNTRFVDGRIRGDAVLLQDQWGQKVWDIAKTMPDAAGFSHVASGKMKREGGRAFVEEIREVLSVDLVTTPATTTNMFESQDGKGQTMEYKDITKEELRTARPDLHKAIFEEGQKSRDEEVQKVIEERDDLKKKVDEFEVKESVVKRAQEVDKLLSESKLPQPAKTDVFRESLLKLEGDDWQETAKKMIEDRGKLCGGVKNMGSPNSDTKTGDGSDLKTCREALNQE